MSRGRPIGSVMPEEQRRKRKDYRLSPATLTLIEQWCPKPGEEGKPNATAFIEKAIEQYVAFLSGQGVECSLHLQEIEQLQTRISDLEHSVRTKEVELRLARDEVQSLKSGKQVVTSGRRTPSYQILVRHEAGICPVLPDGFQYDNQIPDISPYRCPVHEVFSKGCSIAIARQTLERLKSVAGLKEIWLAKNGYAIDSDRWLKEHKQWVRN